MTILPATVNLFFCSIEPKLRCFLNIFSLFTMEAASCMCFELFLLAVGLLTTPPLTHTGFSRGLFFNRLDHILDVTYLVLKHPVLFVFLVLSIAVGS